MTQDALVKIRPRIFLEGNYFLDLDPGSPSAPELASGDDDPRHPHGDGGAVRRDPDGAPGAAAATSSAACWRVTEPRSRTGRPRRRTSPRIRGAGPDRGGGAEPVVRLRRQGRPRRLTGRRGVPRDRAGRPGPVSSPARRARSPHSRCTRSSSATWSATGTPSPGRSPPSRRTSAAPFEELPPTLQTTRTSLANLSRTLPTLRRWAIEFRPSLAELPGDDRGREPVARTGRAAALEAGGRGPDRARPPCHARTSPPPARPGSPRCRRSTSSAGARARCWCRPATR